MAPVLSIEQRARIAARYEVWESVVQVQRWWRARYGRHTNLDPKTIKNCHKKFLTTGSVLDAKRTGRPSTSRSEENIHCVKVMFDKSPSKSTRRAASESELTRHSILRVLHDDLHYHPWKPHYVQQLFPEDCDRRAEYCEMMLTWLEDWPELYQNVLWTDEAVFHVGGFVNRHNCHYWAKHDPKKLPNEDRTRLK